MVRILEESWNEEKNPIKNLSKNFIISLGEIQVRNVAIVLVKILVRILERILLKTLTNILVRRLGRTLEVLGRFLVRSYKFSKLQVSGTKQK